MLILLGPTVLAKTSTNQLMESNSPLAIISCHSGQYETFRQSERQSTVLLRRAFVWARLHNII